MIVFPKAKINLGLRITGKRSDGYHDIETIFYPVGLNDALEFVVSNSSDRKDILTSTGISTGSSPDDNLAMKTVRKLREKYSFPYLRIHLHKVIPIGAGLGGGSSDATCLLKALIKYFGLFIDEERLKALALELGSDCPFFIEGTPAFATGRGEILRSINPVLAGYYLILLNPGVRIDTREAYQNCHTEHPKISLIQLIDQPFNKWKDLIVNDFEEYAFKKFSIIGEIKNELYCSGALFSLMSGSGSSVYGIFSEKPKVSDKLKGYVIWEGVL
ncbi:MAG TPA: 4-(cytidine 5'-diphospho)-2-C-methyl-D-erythritol kinase [Bacteroidales bacterium]